MKSVGMSKIGLVRKQNEDRFAITRTSCIVTDGMGGYKGGALASTLAIDEIVHFLESHSPIQQSTLIDAITCANTSISRRAKEEPALKGMGTTAVIASVVNKTLYWANVGDSRLYVYSNHQLEQITTDHSMVHQLYVDGHLKKEELLQHPQRNLLTRAVGVESTVKVDSGEISVQSGDRILLCSDGLTGYADDTIIADTLEQISSDEEALNHLMSMVYDLGASDNVTIIIGTV